VFVILPDVIEPGLRVVFCGTAVGTKSAQAGAYYAGPGNSFWATLREVGLPPRQLRPSESAELIRYGIGLTDICKLSSGSDRAVGTGGFDVPRLVATLERYAPGWIAFNGKKAAEAALGRPVGYGRQPERLGPTRVFVLPSSSGAARGFWDVRYWRELAETI
jgi:double-stranded uracil-DNA glycosylase